MKIVLFERTHSKYPKNGVLVLGSNFPIVSSIESKRWNRNSSKLRFDIDEIPMLNPKGTDGQVILGSADERGMGL